jgi:site-specific DNA recombinase
MSPEAGTAIYVRISRDRDGDELGVGRQEDDCRALCERRRWRHVEVIVDNDVSAYSRKQRPGYARLVDGIKNGTIARVVVWHPDRLHRSPRELEDFIDLIEETGCDIATVTAGDYDLATPEGRLVARITGSVARKESEDKSRRLRRKHVELAASGKSSGGGTRPFGYVDRHTVDPVEAALVRDAVERLLGGATLRGICTEWNERGVGTVTGTRWSPTVLKRLVTSGRVCGWREHHGELVAPAAWPAIVDRADVDALRVILGDPGRRRNLRARRYLLTGGIARCGLCDAALVARPRDDGRRTYICTKDYGGCGKVRRLADPLERWVADLIAGRLDSDDYRRAVAVEDGRDPSREVAALQAKLEELAGEWAADRLTRGEWAAARQKVQARLAEAQRRLAPRPKRLRPGSGRQLAAGWDDLTFDEQRAHVDALVDQVVVLPAVRGRNTFDPSRIVVTWRV